MYLLPDMHPKVTDNELNVPFFERLQEVTKPIQKVVQGMTPSLYADVTC